ncbi:MAG: hypothetical protein AAFR28_05225 [Pseudomonadota bacterium]
MNVANIEKLKKEQADLRKKLADEEAKFAAKLGQKLIKSFGLDQAESASDLIEEKVKTAGPENVLHALRAIVGEPTRGPAPSAPGYTPTDIRRT